jgi:putative hydrolase of the HAD superfamily
MLDVDGVLISGRPADGQNWAFSLWEDLGIDPQSLVEQFFSSEWKDVVTGKRDILPALSSSLERVPTSVTAEELLTYWFEMDSRIVNSVLTDCRTVRANGISVYLTTNQEHRRAKYLMETLGLQSEVDGIVYSAQAGVQKPHPNFYDYASKATGRDTSELILVDYTKENVEGAINAGWDAVHWNDNMRLADILHRSIRQ